MSDITRVLQEVSNGNKDAVKDLFPLVYREFRALAHHFMQGECSGHTLVPTGLVHETYLKMIDQSRVQWKDRQHFFSIGALAMRRLLIDHARSRKRRHKAQPVVPIELAIDVGAPIRSMEDLIDLDDALTKLEKLDKRQAKIVELRVFAGLTVNEVAETLEVSTRTVEYEWTMIKAWLRRAIKESGNSE